MTVSLPKFTPTPALPKYRTRFASHNTPTAVAPGETLSVTLSIQNVGSATWPQGGANPVRLGFYWSDEKGQKITLPPQVDFRTPLTRDVPPNSTVVLRAQLRTPDRPGRYQLRWDLIQEGAAGFVAQGDAGLLVSPITVNPAVPRAVAPTPAAQPAPVPAVAAAAPVAASAPVAAPAPVAPVTPAATPAVPVAAAAPAPTAVHVSIQNVIEQLARHPSKQYTTRTASDIRRIIIHHTATPPNVTVERIAQFLVNNRDLPGITYHFCITAEGVAYQTQPLVVTSAHAGQDSRDSIGVCLIGNFVNTVPPSPQLQAAASVLAQLLGAVKLTPNQIFGYNEIASTASPGNTWPAWKSQLLTQVQAFLGGTPAPTPAAPAAPASTRAIPSAPAAAPATPAPTATAPATASVGVDKPIDHYLLLWHKGPADWAEWSLRAAFDYLERFPVTIGFSTEEAKRAKYVTILGGPEGIPTTAEAALQAAGCRVERITGASETEIRQALRELARQGKRFQTLQ